MAAWPVEGYRQLLAHITGRKSSAHGFSQRAIESAEAQLGAKIPVALRDYYLSVGRHELNRVNNRLVPPEELAVSQGRLVFMGENQCVVFWGVRARTPAVDPVVFQTMDPDDGEWVAEVRSSLFLPAMLCWHAANGSMPHTGYTNEIDRVAARRLVRGWPSAGRSGGHSAFARDGQVVCLAGSGGRKVIVHVGTRGRKSFDDLASEFGLAIHKT